MNNRFESFIPSSEAGGWLEIDLKAIADNWLLLAARVAPSACAAVIKANGYGLGLEPVMRTLYAAGCRTFFVAHLSEAIRARRVCDVSDIYVLNGLMPQTSSVYINNNLRPVLGSLDECIEWHALTQSEGRDLAFALHIDTGMNRLGLSVDEAHILARDHADFMTTCTLVMSHLSSAEDVTDCATENQIARFETVKALFPTITASLSNSSGIFHPEKPFYDLVRPGYALYGGNPTPDQHNPMHPVVTLKGRIIQTRDVRAGEAVGYNGQWHASQNKRLAVIGVGYGDGYPRGATSTDAKREANMPFGEALIAGVRCAFAGRVSMDLITLDVTDVPEAEVHRGAVVTLIGKGLDLDIVANNAGTIGYELLTHFGARYERHYKER